MRHQAIYNTHPNVKYISQNIAYDVNNNVIDVDESLVQAKIAELEAEEPMRLLRIERDKLLQQTDWRATIDYPGTDQEAWLSYRQALRDLPSNQTPELDENGNLINITWPEEPV